MQGAGTIGSLGKYLKAVMPLPIQVEALHALHNLCKISRQRQEAAASAGLVPYLMNLAQMSPKQVPPPRPYTPLPKLHPHLLLQDVSSQPSPWIRQHFASLSTPRQKQGISVTSPCTRMLMGTMQ